MCCVISVSYSPALFSLHFCLNERVFCLRALHLFQEDVRPTTELVQSLIDTHTALDVKIAKSKMSVFKDSLTLESTAFDKQNR